MHTQRMLSIYCELKGGICCAGSPPASVAKHTHTHTCTQKIARCSLNVRSDPGGGFSESQHIRHPSCSQTTDHIACWVCAQIQLQIEMQYMPAIKQQRKPNQTAECSVPHKKVAAANHAHCVQPCHPVKVKLPAANRSHGNKAAAVTALHIVLPRQRAHLAVATTHTMTASGSPAAATCTA